MRGIFKPYDTDAVNECRVILKEVVIGLEKDWLCKFHDCFDRKYTRSRGMITHYAVASPLIPSPLITSPYLCTFPQQ